MALHNDIGKAGEDAAVGLLKKGGYTIRERNWQLHHLEVDIIAENKQNIVFVEVKTRSSLFGDKQPEEYVDDVKKNNISRCANSYVRMYHIEKDVRFDIVSVLLDSQTLKVMNIRHIVDAFDVPMRTVGKRLTMPKRRRTI